MKPVLITVGLVAFILTQPAGASAQAPGAPPNPAYKVKVEILQNLMNQAIDKISKNQLRPAAKLLTRCIQLESRYPPCHRALAMIYDHQGNVHKAMAENKIYLRLNHQAEDSQSVQGLMLPMAPALLGGGASFNNDDD